MNAMKFIHKIILGSFLSVVSFTSCGDFLKEQSNELVYATSCQDLNELLVGNGYMQFKRMYSMGSFNDVYYPWLYVMDDDVSEVGSSGLVLNSSPIGIMRKFYMWDENPYVATTNGKESKDETWRKIYAHLSIVNLVISEIKNFPDDDKEIRRKVAGEALFLRGAYYFLLANNYAKPYSAETAKEDLCVPLKLTEYVEDKYYTRDDNELVYTQIVKDLSAAADSLAGIKEVNCYRANERAARTLLSRVYLYMHEYSKAIAECERVIGLGAPVMELNGLDFTETGHYKEKKQYLLDTDSPEIFFTQGTSFSQVLMNLGATFKGVYRMSDELKEVFLKTGSGKDLRLKAYFTQDRVQNYYVRKNSIRQTKIFVFDSFVLRSAEVYMNKAEAEVYAGLEDECKKTLKVFLPKRFLNQEIPDVDNLTGEDLVRFVREERRRELCYECHRWFDLRRYAVHPRFPETHEIIHEILAPGANHTDPPVSDGSYMLKEYGGEPAYVMPIPSAEIEFNKGSLEGNEPRVKREKL